MLAIRGLWWVLSGALLLACSGKTHESPDGTGGGGGGGGGGVDGVAGAANHLDLGLGGGGALSGPDSACPGCPVAPDVQICCAEICGYLNTESGECTASFSSTGIRPIVAAHEGVLCSPPGRVCESGEGCPPETPAEGSACREDVHCNYCVPTVLPRMMRCLERAWVTIGPNPPCGYWIDPVR